MCVRWAGFAGAWSEFKLTSGPVACGVVEEVMQPAREICASALGEQMFCSAEATWEADMLRHQSHMGRATVQCGCGEIRACEQVKG